MLRFTIPAATLSALLLTACGSKPLPPPRAALAVPDRSQFQACLDLAPTVPILPPYEAVTLPDGRVVVLLERVRERDTIAARFIVAEREGRLICRASTAYADTWSAEIEAINIAN